MDLKEFLQSVLPSSGEYYVLSGRKTLKTKVAQTVDGAIALVEDAKRKQENVYIGLAGFKPGTDRKKVNVTGKQCFYIDLDVGAENHKYPSKNDAYAGLKAFLAASGFPVPSLIVDSGGGLHAYWVTNQVLMPAEWDSMALGLKQLASQHGLKHDAAVCADSARILRVPSTFNWKDPAKPRECKVVKNTSQHYDVSELREHLPKSSNVVPIMPGVFGDNGFDNIIATTNTQPRYMKHIIDQCGVAKHTAETHGADDDYPAWFSMLTLLLFCDDGETYVHPFSNGHAAYNAHTVTQKWRSRQADKDIGAVHGATTCETFHSFHPEICEACPHWKSPDRGVNWSSPIHFGLPPIKVELPYPYVLLSNGHTGKRAVNDAGEPEIVLAFDGQVTDFLVYDMSPLGVIVTWRHTLPGGREVEVDVTSVELVDQKLFNKSVASSLFMDDNGAKELRKMAQSFSKQVQNARAEIKAPMGHGWTRDGKRVGFRHGDIIYWSDGTEQVISTLSSSGHIGIAGDYDKWTRMVRQAMKAKHIETEVLIAAAFAAPLVHMSHVEGAILSAVSLRSGTGKTTAMRLGQAVWGHPTKAMFSLSDTPNSIFHRMGRYCNLPAMWDDLRIPDTRREARATVDMIYQITQGREKSRMTSNIDLREIHGWKTLLVCSSNSGLAPFIELVDQGGSAAQHRMLEFEVSPLDPQKACSPSVFNELEEHYGHAGAVYAKYLVTHYDAAKALFNKNHAAIQQQLNARPEDRFTVMAITTIITGAMLAMKADIVQFDVRGMLHFLIKAFNVRREEIAQVSNEVGAENSIVELISMFMMEKQLNTLYMKHYPKKGPGEWGQANLIRMAEREAVVSVAVLDNEIRVHKTLFDKWARANGKIAVGKQMCSIDGITAGRRNVINYSRAGDTDAPYCYSIKRTAETEMIFSELPSFGGAS